MTQPNLRYPTITRKALPAAAFWGRWLRFGSGGCTGIAMALAIGARDWPLLWLSAGVAFTALASVVMHFEVSDDDT